jgi:opacity protein-like surface antigen
MRIFLVPILLCACAAGGLAQVAEVSLSGGVSRFGDAKLLDNPRITLGDGFRLAVRLTLNTYRFFGHEIGYGYAHSSADLTSVGSGTIGLPVHQGFYDFLAYATPEDSRIRPFACGGIQFSSFFPPGSSVYSGNQITKFGINYGGGLKMKLTGPWGARVDFRQYNSGKPDLFATPTGPSGRLKQNEISAGVFFSL